MKITFLFNGIITDKQMALVDAEIMSGNEIEIIKSLGTDTDFELLVYGNGFSGLEDLANSVSWLDHVPAEEVIEPIVKKKKSRKSKTVVKSNSTESED